jgi:hypothetical protein
LRKAVRLIPAELSCSSIIDFFQILSGSQRIGRTGGLLEKPKCEPAQIFDFNLSALNEIFGSMLDHDDPAKRGNREKDQPEHPAKIAHSPIVRVCAIPRKRAACSYLLLPADRAG